MIAKGLTIEVVYVLLLMNGTFFLVSAETAWNVGSSCSYQVFYVHNLNTVGI